MAIERGPGVCKVKRAPLMRRRTVALVGIEDGPLRDVLDGADVVSEGGSREEGEEVVYYGSTNLLLVPTSRGGTVPDGRLGDLAVLLAHDPHVRVRAVRVAHREALVRAAAPLGPLRAEMAVTATARGLELAIDVIARVILDRSSRPRRATGGP